MAEGGALCTKANAHPTHVAETPKDHSRTKALPNALECDCNSVRFQSFPSSDHTKDTSIVKDDRVSACQVSISGVGRIFGVDVPCWRRVSWILVLVTCFGLTLSQVWDRVTYFRSTPVNVNVRVTRNISLMFPLVTFCNKNVFNMTAINELKSSKAEQFNVTDEEVISKWQVRDFVGFNGMTPRDVWDATSHSLNMMLKECWFGRGITCFEVGQWEKVYTVLGVCYQFRTFKPVFVSGLFNNMYVKLRDLEVEKFDNESGFKILIHDPKDDAIIDVRTHGSSIEEGWGKDARVAVREFKTIPTYSRPCVMEADYSSSKCISRCFMDTLLKKVGCLMPYMEAYLSEAPFCSTGQQYASSNEGATKLLFYGNWKPTACTCPKQCYENIYTVFTETLHTGANTARLRIYFQDLTYDEVSEEMAYDAIALLCDIGGTLGLLLGASVLTIFEILEIAWENFFHLLRNAKTNSGLA